VVKVFGCEGKAARFFEGEVRGTKTFSIDPSFLRTCTSKKRCKARDYFVQCGELSCRAK
jgi:hypothetical protein